MCDIQNSYAFAFVFFWSPNHATVLCTLLDRIMERSDGIEIITLPISLRAFCSWFERESIWSASCMSTNPTWMTPAAEIQRPRCLQYRHLTKASQCEFCFSFSTKRVEWCMFAAFVSVAWCLFAVLFILLFFYRKYKTMIVSVLFRNWVRDECDVNLAPLRVHWLSWSCRFSYTKEISVISASILLIYMWNDSSLMLALYRSTKHIFLSLEVQKEPRFQRCVLDCLATCVGFFLPKCSLRTVSDRG